MRTLPIRGELFDEAAPTTDRDEAEDLYKITLSQEALEPPVSIWAVRSTCGAGKTLTTTPVRCGPLPESVRSVSDGTIFGTAPMAAQSKIARGVVGLKREHRRISWRVETLPRVEDRFRKRQGREYCDCIA